jgi:hypothetical protein
MPSVAGPRTVGTNPPGVGSAKFQASLTDGFVVNHNAALAIISLTSRKLRLNHDAGKLTMPLEVVSAFALYSAPAEIIPVGIRPPESELRRKAWSTDLSDHNWSHDDPCSILRWPHSPSPACDARRSMRSFPRFGDHKGVTFSRGSTVAVCSAMSQPWKG